VRVEREPDATGEQRDAEVVEADALLSGVDCELGVQVGGQAQDELAGGGRSLVDGAHGADSTACDIAEPSTVCDTDAVPRTSLLSFVRMLRWPLRYWRVALGPKDERFYLFVKTGRVARVDDAAMPPGQKIPPYKEADRG
jgi:hypothetical protein